MVRTRVKICGITNLDDALAAAQAGADAIGLVFYPQSPRNVSIEQARQIVTALPAFTSSVGLFVNAEPSFISSVLQQVPLDLLQFHGDEPEPECSGYGRPYIKAIRMQEGVDLVHLCQTFGSSRGILLDTFVAGKAGGTGQVFDWSRVPPQLPKPIILAGGLDPSNIAKAVTNVRPWAVDVSGGVELVVGQGKEQIIKKGKKDAERIRSFIEGVNSVSN
ncbi:phosphoribosylanthranilate isomerase [Ketobacter sp. MCCC 1A13808]|uniref:phosphoribosylanthranilate isomerase n=1 Tax=Ketobacter sp. MCCC 1A13808 TaxID=2602738 RepID=UPI00132551DF|nr:phosphoribosylanthranilate isomerase [Ketobacter sp. MCCC 1A13808]MVF12464.1 phosphoribosylanthranilate isomerase [Ketobacter sp. MCCC 1A13808]